MKRTSLSSAAMVVAIAVLGACGVQPDSAPRLVPEENRANLAGVSAGGEAAGADRIYLVEPGEARLLRSVARDAESPEDLIRILFRGPNEDELDQQYGSAIPPGLRLNDSRLQGPFLYLDVSDELKQSGGTALVQALAQIVYTASELEGVQSVVITVNGDQVAWPKGNLESTLGPLRLYDYPGMVRTAQPAYPSVPSGAL